MSREQNLKSWTKGQSGNPKGKPKGAKNRSTIIKEILNLMVKKVDADGKAVWQSKEYLMGSKSVIVRANATKLPAPEPLPGPTGIPSAFAHLTISATIKK